MLSTETNPLTEEELERIRPPDDSPLVSWDSKQLRWITRIRLVRDPVLPAWDLAYVWGTEKGGAPCRVKVPFETLPLRSPIREMVAFARVDRVWLTGLCGGSIERVVSKVF